MVMNYQGDIILLSLTTPIANQSIFLQFAGNVINSYTEGLEMLATRGAWVT